VTLTRVVPMWTGISASFARPFRTVYSGNQHRLGNAR
jgi:hypothetical protein